MSDVLSSSDEMRPNSMSSTVNSTSEDRQQRYEEKMYKLKNNNFAEKEAPRAMSKLSLEHWLNDVFQQLSEDAKHYFLPRGYVPREPFPEEHAALQFHRKFISTNRPVVFTSGISDTWPAVLLWQNDQYLRARMTGQKVQTYWSPGGRANCLSQGYFVRSKQVEMDFEKAFDAVLKKSQTGEYDGQFKNFTPSYNREPCYGIQTEPNSSHGHITNNLNTPSDEINSSISQESQKSAPIWPSSASKNLHDALMDLNGSEHNIKSNQSHVFTAESTGACEIISSLEDDFSILSSDIATIGIHKDQNHPEPKGFYEDIDLAFGSAPESLNVSICNETTVCSLQKSLKEKLYVAVRGERRIVLFPPTDIVFLNEGYFPVADFVYNTEEERWMIVPEVNPITGPNLTSAFAVDPFRDKSLYQKAFECVIKPGEAIYIPAMWSCWIAQTGVAITIEATYQSELDIKYLYNNFLQNISDCACHNLSMFYAAKRHRDVVDSSQRQAKKCRR